MDIFHHPVYYLKHVVSGTGFCLHLKVEPTWLGPMDRARLSLDTSSNTNMVYNTVEHTLAWQWHSTNKKKAQGNYDRKAEQQIP
jgi:hypothetical protein